jgi:hypothetical protein
MRRLCPSRNGRQRHILIKKLRAEGGLIVFQTFTTILFKLLYTHWFVLFGGLCNPICVEHFSFTVYCARTKTRDTGQLFADSFHLLRPLFTLLTYPVPGSLDKKGGRRCLLLLNKRCPLLLPFLPNKPSTALNLRYLLHTII